MSPVVGTRAELLPIEHRRLFEIAGGLLGLQAAVVRLRLGPELSEGPALHQFTPPLLARLTTENQQTHYEGTPRLGG